MYYMNVSRNDIAKDVSQLTKVSINQVKGILDGLEYAIFQRLRQTKEDEDTKINLFDGFVVTCKYVPEKRGIANYSNEEIFISSRLRPRVKITKNYKQKLNE